MGVLCEPLKGNRVESDCFVGVEKSEKESSEKESSEKESSEKESSEKESSEKESSERVVRKRVARKRVARKRVLLGQGDGVFVCGSALCLQHALKCLVFSSSPSLSLLTGTS